MDPRFVFHEKDVLSQKGKGSMKCDHHHQLMVNLLGFHGIFKKSRKIDEKNYTY